MSDTSRSRLGLTGAVALLLASITAVIIYQAHRLRETLPERQLEAYHNTFRYERGAETPSDAARPDLITLRNERGVEIPSDAAYSNAAVELAQVDKQLLENPRDAGLLAEKVHLAIEVDPGAAVGACREILTRDPKNYFALHHCAVAYMMLGDSDKALYYAGSALQVQDSAELQNTIAQIFYRRGDVAHARDHFQQALQQEPTNASALHGLKVIDQYLAQHTAP